VSGNPATGRLPHGYLDADGAVHAEFELRALTGREEELLARSGGRGSAAAVTEVLRRCLSRLGTLDTIDAATVRGMLVGDRQYLMLKLREATFGDLVRGSAPCPWPDCGHRVAIAFSTHDVPVVAATEREIMHTLVLSEHAGTGSAADRTVRFRLPTGADQEELSPLFAQGEAAALTALLHACVLCVGSREADDAVAALTPLARQEIEDRMAAIAPRLDLVMTATCVECGRAFEAPFDLQGFFFGEAALAPDTLRREIHYLAYHYHWSERDILDMDRDRRRGYIEILSDEIERLNERA
jgi:hypothetical protein